MMQQIQTLGAAARANARMVVQDAGTYSQAAALKAAEAVAGAKTPARVLFDAGLRFNGIAYGAVAGLIETQRDALLGAVDGGVARLRAAADAPSLKALWEGQVALFPVGLDRLKGDLDRAVGVVKSYGSEVKALATDTKAELTGTPVVPKRKAAAPKAKVAKKTTARKVAKKAAAKAASKA